MPTLKVPKPNQSSFAFASRGEFRQEYHDPDQIENADRQIDIKHPAPAVILGEPAAEHGAQHGPDHDADAKQRHGKSLALARIAAKQNGLRQRNKRRAERALQDPEQHELRQRLRHAAQH